MDYKEMEDDRIGFFSRIVQSLQGNDLYLKIRKETNGKAIKYFMLLVLLLATVSMLQFTVAMNTGIHETSLFLKNNVPDFRLSNGILEVNAPMPIIMKDENSMYVVDTTGEYNENFLDSYEQGMFISADKLVYKKNKLETQTFKFVEFKQLTFKKADALALIDQWSGPLLAIIGILGVLFILAGKFVSLMILSVVGMIVNAIMKTKLLYGNVFKTSAYAITLPLILKTFLGLISLTIPFFFVVYYGIAIFYFQRAFKLKDAVPPELIEISEKPENTEL